MFVRRFVVLAVLAAWAAPCSPGFARQADTPRKCPMGREYFLYTPEKPDPDRTYWLVVGVHGYRGKGRGAAGLARWVAMGNCIVLGPTFPSEGYQYLHKDSDKQLLDLFKELHKKHRIHKKMFLHGYSGGSQFVSRFAMKYPEYVVGCGAHSGGTWPTGERWGGIGTKARHVPFAMSCGEKDTAKSFSSAPWSRFAWAKKFGELMRTGGFFYKERYWPGVGHGGSRKAVPLSLECYWLSITGMYPPQRKKVETEIGQIRALIAAGRRDRAEPRIKALPALAGPAAPPAKSSGPRKENEHGWYESASGNEAMAKTRREFLAEQARELTARLKRKAG